MRQSALYEGTIMHSRPGGGDGGFVHRVAMPFLDLDEVDRLADLTPLWSTASLAPVRFRRADFLKAHPGPLRNAVTALVEQRVGFRPGGPVRLLAHHRTWGWLFNPISLYYCYAPGGERLEAVVADVTSTPWGESHAYVLDTRDGVHDLPELAKEMHVSPFLGMDLSYRFRLTEPGARCGFSVTVLRGPAVVLRTGFSLRRHPLTRRALAGMLIRHPLMTHRVSWGIYAHAAALWLRRTPFVAHTGALR